MQPLEHPHYEYTAPPYCTNCGNLEFWCDVDGWRCSWCVPMPQRKVKFVNKKELQVVGEPFTETRTRGWFTARDVAKAWPCNFRPPHPVGPAKGAVRFLDEDDE